MAVLAILILILLVLRSRESQPEVERRAPNPIGSSMTIGDRELQQDHFGSALGDEGAIMVLADGMGRREGGKIAARIAVDTFLDLYNEYQAFDKPQYYFRRAYQLANHKILNTLEERQGMASAAVALVRNSTLYYALVGSVRIAVYRNGDLIPVSEGQTIDVLACRRYEEGRISKQTARALLEDQRLYNVLGKDDFHDIEFFSKPLTLCEGDVVLMMTDGVSHALKWVEIENTLRRGGSPDEMAGHVIEAVNRSNVEDKDNASVLLYQNYTREP